MGGTPGRVSLMKLIAPATSPDKPLSFTPTLNAREKKSRSLSRRSKPSSCLPVYAVSRAEAEPAVRRIVTVSGEKVIEFSDTSPKSSISTGFRARLAAEIGIRDQNSMFSIRERSDPLGPRGVRIDRQRRPLSVLLTLH